MCGLPGRVGVLCSLCGLSGSISSKEVVCPFLPLPTLSFLSLSFTTWSIVTGVVKSTFVPSHTAHAAALLVIARD